MACSMTPTASSESAFAVASVTQARASALEKASTAQRAAVTSPAECRHDRSSSIMPLDRLDTMSGMPQAAMAAPARHTRDPCGQRGFAGCVRKATRPATASCSAPGRAPMKRAWDATNESASSVRAGFSATCPRSALASRSAWQARATAWATRAFFVASTGVSLRGSTIRACARRLLRFRAYAFSASSVLPFIVVGGEGRFAASRALF